ncbi:adenosylcobinamide-GDP ribazoletransferase [Cochlodiniinecator piscidefendens]|uniref:adenosylcobinamide-GDP ribazoletransferase n=1 Tax=Cochlodiniinecator piscidefendens TaxID=2715756 RepID=UPI00140A28F0|nr:adenosylcobinamide-GDP ribazoletransferase [Cochlodiniinecator piscidefendens]
MALGDQNRFHISDIPAAIGLLSRLPVPVDMERAQARGAKAAWAYPVAGAVIGLLTALFGAALVAFDISYSIAAALILGFQIIITGAMHEDGLADSADGLWGGWERTKRLEIMKDSHIGTYGVLALGLSLLIRWSALSLVIASDYGLIALIAVAAISRAPMVAMMAALPNARQGGLSKAVGKPDGTSALIASIIGTGLALILLGFSGFVGFIYITLTSLACALIANKKIGGQTGDILGATQQISEITFLVVLTACI